MITEPGRAALAVFRFKQQTRPSSQLYQPRRSRTLPQSSERYHITEAGARRLARRGLLKLGRRDLGKASAWSNRELQNRAAKLNLIGAPSHATARNLIFWMVSYEALCSFWYILRSTTKSELIHEVNSTILPIINARQLSLVMPMAHLTFRM